MNEILYRYAMKYITAGVAAIPTWPDRRKNPRLSSITEYRQTLPTASEWKRWATAYPKSNIALITGYWRLCALDFDDIGSFNSWYMNVSEKWRDTWIVATGRGKHVYFWAEDRDVGKDRYLVRGHREVLLRACGAYVIAPPSIHHTGVPYRTDVKHAPVKTRIDWITAGWGPKAAPEVGGHPPARPNRVQKSPKKPSILDWIQPYSRKPNNRGAYRCFCPFHDDSTPSAWVNPETNRFGCNKPGCEGYGQRPDGRQGWLDVVNVASLIEGRPNNELMKALYHHGDMLAEVA